MVRVSEGSSYRELTVGSSCLLGYSNLFLASKKTHGICHRYLKLMSEFCNRNIIRVGMENLSTDLSISGRLRAILASFSSTVERATVELKLAKIALKRPEMLRTFHKQDKQSR